TAPRDAPPRGAAPLDATSAALMDGGCARETARPSEIPHHQPLHPLGHRRVGARVERRHVGLHVEHRRPVDGVEALHGEHRPAPPDDAHRRDADGVRPVLGPLGKDAELRHVLTAARAADEVLVAVEARLVHPEHDERVRELLDPHQPRREVLVEMHLGHDLAPVVVARLGHGALHHADGARLDVVHAHAHDHASCPSGIAGFTFTLFHLDSCTSPAGAPRGFDTSDARQKCTSVLASPRDFEYQAAAAAATSTTSGGTSTPSGFRTTTWLPAVPPATCSHRSRGSATWNVRWSLS